MADRFAPTMYKEENTYGVRQTCNRMYSTEMAAVTKISPTQPSTKFDLVDGGEKNADTLTEIDDQT